jgi:hypothetical protein
MKKVSLLLVIFAALLVAQTSNAQIVRTYFTMPAEYHCFDEYVAGDLVFMNTTHYDKKTGEIKRLFFVNQTGWLVGESGTLYKVVDVGTSTPNYKEPFPVPADGEEFTLINNMKIIAKGTGKVNSGRAQINFFFDKDGNFVVKKDINTTCF